MTVIMAFLSIIAITDVAFYYLSGATLPVSGVLLGVVVLILLILEVSLLLLLSLHVRSEAGLFRINPFTAPTRTSSGLKSA